MMVSIKRMILLILFATASMMTSCSSSKNVDYSNEYKMYTDAPHHLISQGHNQRMVEVEDGFYILNSNYIYYADKSSMKPVLLDSNPNSDCLANNEMPKNCNAFVYLAAITNLHFLSHYNGFLYTIEQTIDLNSNLFDLNKYRLVKIAMDGSSRSVVLEFDYKPYFLALHRGVLYATTERITSPESGRTYKLLAYDLESIKNEPTVIFENNVSQGTIADIYPYGKNIYFRESILPASPYYRYDLESKQIQEMFPEANETHDGYIEAIKDNTLIYSIFGGDLMDKEGWIPRTVTLDNQNPQTIDIDSPFLSYYYWVDGDPYLYQYPVQGYEDLPGIEVKNEITVFDEQYQIVTNIPTPEFTLKTVLLTGNQHYMFAYTSTEDSYIWYMLDKSQISSGNAIFKEWITTPKVNFSYVKDSRN